VDPLSHAVLGATVAHGLFGRRLGLKAAAWGAAAAVLPDIDIFFRVGADDFTALARHRGLTHGLAFAPSLGSLWGYLLARHYARGSPSTATLWRWIGVVTIALWSHPLLDWLTPYGTQLLQPFSDRRFALPVMPIIDPIYTLLLAAGVLLAWRWAPAPRARVASLTAVALSCAYIGYSAHLNDVAEDIATAQLAAMGVTDADVTAYPTLLQIQYRRVVARSRDVDRTGFVNASTPCTIDWGVAPRVDAAHLEQLVATREGRIFEWFTMGMAHATVESLGAITQMRITDLRYGTDNDPTDSIFAMQALFHGTRLATAKLETYRPNPSRYTVGGFIDAAYAGCMR
jgi:inner membrane protein